jgi:uncharacterized protein YcbK (DUF882 family)
LLAPGLYPLNVVSAHTGEKFAALFIAGKRPGTITMAMLSRLLRDHHTGAIKPIDPALIELLVRIQSRTRQPLQALSGYRSPLTNHRLHLANPVGVAEHSFHTRGMAIDFMVAGMSADRLGDIARQCGAGGVGVYAEGFVHVDTGPVREWVG